MLTSRRIIIKREDFLEKVVLFGLILTSMNFAQSFYYLLFFTFCLMFFQRKMLVVDRSFLWSILFTVSLLVFWQDATESMLSLIRIFAFPVAYLFGYNYLSNRKEDDNGIEKQLLMLIVVISTGTFLHLMLNFLINIDLNVGRNTIDIWTGKPLSATGQGALACMMIGCSLGVLMSGITKVKYKLFSVLAIILMFFYNMILAGRTMIALTLVVYMLLLFNYLCHFKVSNKTIRMIFILLLVLVSISICYYLNVFGIRDMILNSNLYNRFFGSSTMGVFEDSRSAIRMRYFEYMPLYFLGGGHIRHLTGNYAHDLYLNVYDEAGIFAFFAVLGLVVSYWVHVIQLLRHSDVSFKVKQIVLGVSIAINIMYLLEPIFLGMPWLIVWLCLLHGAIAHFNNILRKRRVYERSCLI